MNYVFWITVMVVFIVLELATVNLVTIWFAFGALLACIASVLKVGLFGQIAIFTFGTVLLLIFTKPIVKKKLTVKKENTNADRVIGKTAIVTDDITSNKFAGLVKVDGMEWSAISESGCDILTGDTVLIKSIQGVKLVVDKTYSE